MFFKFVVFTLLLGCLQVICESSSDHCRYSNKGLQFAIVVWRYLTFYSFLGHPALSSSKSVLYVLAGQDPSVPNAADFVATENSAKYGSIVRVVPLFSNAASGIGQANNEPHHGSVSSNGRYYITGGLLSFLSNQKEIFVWEIPRNPIDGPRFVRAIDAPGSACPDEFQPIGGSSFLVTMMCNENAGSPGDLVVIDASKCIILRYSACYFGTQNTNNSSHIRFLYRHLDCECNDWSSWCERSDNFLAILCCK